MIDLHTHILPGVDDGSDSVDESLVMARNAAAQGVEKIVATPHYFFDKYRLTPKETEEEVAKLQQIITAEGIDISILPGAEIYITPDIAGKVKDNKISSLNNSRYILLEFPMGRLPDFTNSVFYNLKTLGYIAIIAHPARYSFIRENPNHLYYWRKKGIYAQLNAGSLLGIYGPEISKTAKILVKNRLVHFIASDQHSSDRRSKSLQKALKLAKSIAGDYALQFMINAESVVNDRELKTDEPIFYEVDSVFKKLKKFISFNKYGH